MQEPRHCQLPIRFMSGDLTGIIGNIIATWKLSDLCDPAFQDMTHSSRDLDGVPWKDWSIGLVKESFKHTLLPCVAQ